MTKKNVLLMSTAIYIIGDLVIYLGKTSPLLLIAGLAITGLGIYGIFGITFAIQPDIIDYSEYKNHRSIAGMIAAFQGFCKSKSRTGKCVRRSYSKNGWLCAKCYTKFNHFNLY